MSNEPVSKEQLVEALKEQVQLLRGYEREQLIASEQTNYCADFINGIGKGRCL